MHHHQPDPLRQTQVKPPSAHVVDLDGKEDAGDDVDSCEEDPEGEFPGDDAHHTNEDDEGEDPEGGVGVGIDVRMSAK